MNRPRVTITKAEVDVNKKGDAFIALKMSGSRTVADLSGRYPLPNLVDLMSNLMVNTTPPVRLTRSTLLECLRKMTNLEEAKKNPADFAVEAVRVLKLHLVNQLVGGVSYTKVGTAYEMRRLDGEIVSWEQYLAEASKGPYDNVVVDSSIERAFVDGLDRTHPVRSYIKLPPWFTVPTPVGDYNPDWAIVWEDVDEFGNPTQPKIYMVRETKSTTLKGALRRSEDQKIACATRHCDALGGVDYEVVTSIEDLPHRIV